MRKIIQFALFMFASHAWAGTYTAASCSQADVNAVINGPTHTAVDGDVIQIPAGSCTWTSGISVPSNIGITITGAGTPNSGASTVGASSSCVGGSGTNITDSAGSLFNMSPEYGNSTSRISCIQIIVGSPTGSPVGVTGTCTSSGCPNLRLDNLTAPNGFAGIGISDDAFVVLNNVFGVADHNNVGSSGSVPDNGVDFANVGYGAWQGVGFWGDNSWASADTFGTSQEFYLENNNVTGAFLTDMDDYPGNGNFGGGRAACRFNTFNSVTGATACTDHGTDTIGRVRGGRQIEFYGNSLNCSGGCGSIFGDRSSVSMVFLNTITSGSAGAFVSIDTQRRWREDTPWGPCDGTGAFDTNDGTVYSAETISSYSPTGDNYIVNVSGTPWTNNEWISVNGEPYSFHDVTQDFGFELAASSPNSITSFFSCNGNGCGSTPANGDSFQILRATVCMDQPGRGAGQLVQGGDCNTFPTSGHLCPQLVSTGTTGPVAEALDPSYEVDDAGTVTSVQYVSNDSQGEIANRDWYSQNIGQTAQTSSTSPFNGSSGTGWGTLANRPSTCTKGVGYWNTSEGGTWNNGAANSGALDICTATNTWTSAAYTPYTYPNPLDGGSSAYPITISSITGHGTVTSSDSVINCTTGTTGTCTDSSATGTVTLTFTAATGYTLTSVTGCTLSGTTCSVSSTATITATFTINTSPGAGNGILLASPI